MDPLTIALFAAGSAFVAVAVAGVVSRRHDVLPARPQRVSGWVIFPIALIVAALGAWWMDWRVDRPPRQ